MRANEIRAGDTVAFTTGDGRCRRVRVTKVVPPEVVRIEDASGVTFELFGGEQVTLCSRESDRRC